MPEKEKLRMMARLMGDAYNLNANITTSTRLYWWQNRPGHAGRHIPERDVTGAMVATFRKVFPIGNFS
jgi:hypothetical protein